MSQPKQVINIDSSEFTPGKGYVLVNPEALIHEKVSPGGILIPLAMNRVNSDRPTSGKVVSVGTDLETDVTVESFVIWPNTDGLDLEFNDGAFVLLREKSIIGYKR